MLIEEMLALEATKKKEEEKGLKNTFQDLQQGNEMPLEDGLTIANKFDLQLPLEGSKKKLSENYILR
jgi:hypothetical protein